ncbi:MAG: tRNA pseudouridine(38-40) synthase TruA [Coriobacteriia bacterium]|nr:tRNA pseudouridine(38-40) synthase TruA [Coriobacteriia bacterium]
MENQVIALTLAYIGTDYHGFARQDGLPTIQGALEQALETIYRRPIETVGAGRTDAGVHANGQVVSFTLSQDELDERPLERLQASLNALTSDSMVVRSAVQKPADFSARFSAVSREYRYRLIASRSPSLFLAPYAWSLPEHRIDVNKMREAAPYLEGEHDFKSFCQAASAVDKNTVRTIQKIHIFSMDHLGEPCLVVQVIGNAFLHSMVRIIVGSMVDIGYGRHEPEWLGEVLAALDRRSAGQTAPAHGLTFWRVRY